MTYNVFSGTLNPTHFTSLRPMLSGRCPAVSLCLCLNDVAVGLLWPNGWRDQDATWYTEVGLSPGHVVLDGEPAPLPHGKGHISRHFSADVYSGQTMAHLSNC